VSSILVPWEETFPFGRLLWISSCLKQIASF
jgi:hypothetical protein